MKEKQEKEKANSLELKKALKKKRRKTIYVTVMFNIIGSVIAIGIGLLWQNSYTVLAWANASLLGFIMVFFVGWIMFIHNKNIISIFTHSFKTFGLMIVGKRPAKSYYEVKTEIEENPIPNIYIIITFLYSLLLFIIMTILTILAL